MALALGQQAAEESDLVREWRLREFAVHPAASQEAWQAGLASKNWVERFDVIEALARTPESAWFAFEQGVSMQDTIDFGRASVRGAQLELLARIQGQGGPLAPMQAMGGPPWIGEDSKSALRLGWQRVFLDEPRGEASCAAWIDTLLDGRLGLTETQWKTVGPGWVFAASHLGASASRLMQWPDGRLCVERIQALQPSLLEGPLGTGFLVALRALCHDDSDRFAVAGVELGQVALGVGSAVPDWASLEVGLRQWNPDLAPDRKMDWVLRKRQFVVELARLGQPELGRLLWAESLAIPNGWARESLDALGGEEGARRDFLEWAAESLPVTEALQRGLELAPEQTEWLFDALLLRLSEAPLDALGPWFDPKHPVGVRLTAFSAIEGLPRSPARTAKLLELLWDGDEEMVRRALRALVLEPLDDPAWHVIEQVWSAQSPEGQDRLLRELPPARLSPAFRARCQAGLLEDLDRDGVWIDAVAWGEPSPEAWAVLRAGFTAEFERCRESWAQGKEVPTSRLAHWVGGLLRRNPTEAATLVGPRLLERVEVLARMETRRTYLEFSKQAISTLGKSMPGRQWMRQHLTEARTWPLRLRTEVALQLAGHASEENGLEVSSWLTERLRNDYESLGSVLRERLLTAFGARPGPLPLQLASEARNARANASVRRVAMQVLLAHHDPEPVLFVLRNERAGEGVRLAAELLASYPDPRVETLLRERLDHAAGQILAEEGNTELAEELLVALQVALLAGDHFGIEDERFALLGPSRLASASGSARFLGESEPERWPLEISLCAELAKRGRLAGFLDRHMDRWLALPGAFLVSLAQAAAEGEDPASALRIARLAEAGLRGEAPGQGWLRACLTLDWLRFRLAWEARDWPRVEWYTLVWLDHHGRGGVEDRFFEAFFGGRDLRLQRDPVARLLALWWQARAYQLASTDPAEAETCAAVAEGYCGGSRLAREEQGRLGEWLAQNR